MCASKTSVSTFRLCKSTTNSCQPGGIIQSNNRVVQVADHLAGGVASLTNNLASMLRQI